MDDLSKRRLISFIVLLVIIVGVIIGIISSNTPYVVTQSGQNVLVPQSDKSPTNINGLANLTRTGLSASQAKNIEKSLDELLTKDKEAKSFTIDSSTIKKAFNTTTKHSLYTVNASTNTGKVYTLKLSYLPQNDGIVTITDTSGIIVYSQIQD